MPAAAHRAPLVLAAVALLGIGGRLIRERGEGGDSAAAGVGQSNRGEGNSRVSSPLDSQIARVSQATSRSTRPARRPKGRPPRPTRAGDSTVTPRRSKGATPPSPSDQPRVESTPLGALPAERRSQPTPPSERSVRPRPGQPRIAGDGRGRDRAPTSVLIVDIDRAPAAEIERLPHVGPSLARRIVADRAANGPFRSLQGLQRVRGIGPAIARQLQGHVTFGSEGRP